MIKKFRKLPIVIEAIQYTGDNCVEIMDWSGKPMKHVGGRGGCKGKSPLIIETLEGDMKASVGDWVIRGVSGEFYPCKPDIFSATYEAAED